MQLPTIADMPRCILRLDQRRGSGITAVEDGGLGAGTEDARTSGVHDHNYK